MGARDIVFGSVCSGIEAASVAWNPIGWRAAWLAEIEAYPRALLAYRYPDVPNLGNMLLIPELLRNGAIYPPDVFTGGTPCQAFSLAGLRQSLGDARGNLSLTFCEIANEIDIQRAANGLLPCVVKWENVPGVLSTKDNAFGYFLAGLAGEDDPLVPTGSKWPDAGCVYGPQRTVAWRVLDAQYFGLAQRRRRVFVVASAREGFDPARVLFEFEGMRRDSPPSRSTQENIAGSLTASAGRRGGQPDCGSTPGHLHAVAKTLCAGGHSNNPLDENLVTIAFDSRQDCVSSTEVFGALGSSSPQAQAVCIHADAIGRTGEAITPSADAEGRIRLRNPGLGIINDGTSYNLMASGQAHAVCVTGDITHTLKAEGFDASEDGTGRGQPIVAAHVPVSPTLRAGGNSTGGDRPPGTDVDTADSLLTVGMAVRRLTPIECERLQGFYDNYTLIPVRGKPAADGPRYKALGNSWAVPVVRWIGTRIDAEMRRLDQIAA